MSYDALLVLSFGGPEGPDDVMPFLENVARGRNVPRERLREVAEHYYLFGGRTPINEHNRALIKALEAELARAAIRLPVYWGNRNWHPRLEDTLRRMRDDGVRHALCFVTSAFSSYSGCRQYREDIARAQAAIGEGAPRVDKMRVFFNHPGFIETMVERVRDACEMAIASPLHLVFTAHSIPLSMAAVSFYEAQLREACRLVTEGAGHPEWTLVFQSRSGPPSQPWMEPDVVDWMREFKRRGRQGDVVLVPIGFLSDHMEVLYDLDVEARKRAEELDIHLIRAGTPGVHPRFVCMIRELVEEKLCGAPPLSVGSYGLEPAQCSETCCPPPRRPASP